MPHSPRCAPASESGLLAHAEVALRLRYTGAEMGKKMAAVKAALEKIIDVSNSMCATTPLATATNESQYGVQACPMVVQPIRHLL